MPGVVLDGRDSVDKQDKISAILKDIIFWRGSDWVQRKQQTLTLKRAKKEKIKGAEKSTDIWRALFLGQFL
jgi:hypothetical protein